MCLLALLILFGLPAKSSVNLYMYFIIFILTGKTLLLNDLFLLVQGNTGLVPFQTHTVLRTVLRLSWLNIGKEQAMPQSFNLSDNKLYLPTSQS